MRAIIVDDEPLARHRLRTLLEEQPDIVVVAECVSGEEAILAIARENPDILFLDVQMPEVDGFDVLATIGIGRVPVVIFVTAYDQFAMRAFEAHALDYLLKPFDDERFDAALQRARTLLARHHEPALEARLRAMLDSVRGERRYLQRLVVRTGVRAIFVRTADIDWLEADGKYVRLNVQGKRHLLRTSLTKLSELLDPALFCRIHRATVVNVERIAEIVTLPQGDHHVVLRDGTRLAAGRSYWRSVLALMGTEQ